MIDVHDIDYSATTASWTLRNEITDIIGLEHDIVDETIDLAMRRFTVRDNERFSISSRPTFKQITWIPWKTIGWSYHGTDVTVNVKLPWSGRGTLVWGSRTGGRYGGLLSTRLNRAFRTWIKENPWK